MIHPQKIVLQLYIQAVNNASWCFVSSILKMYLFLRDEKEPLKDTADEALKRNSSVEFDGRRVYATSGGPIIGKNSAV